MRKHAFIRDFFTHPLRLLRIRVSPLKRGVLCYWRLKGGLILQSYKWFLICLSITLIATFSAHDLMACGPFFDRTVFTYSVHPDFPLDEYANGNLGIIQPTYARSYLYAAYRYLAGIGFDQDEQKAIVSLWNDRLNLGWEQEGTEWIQKWQDVRSKVTQAGQSPEIRVYSEITGNWWFDYLNYKEDAFVNAAKTLNDRIEKFGADSPEVLDWVQAQDKVFSNSSKPRYPVDESQDNTPSIPDPAKPDADPIIKADRTYQIASANFYANNFDTAEKLFREIADDKSSQWSKLAPYLVARTLVRKATLTVKPGAADIGTLAQAVEELNDILSDNNLSELHPAAQRLLSFVNFRLDPEGTLQELSVSILKKGQGENLRQLIDDYTQLLDKFLSNYRYMEESEKLENASKYFTDLSDLREDDVTDWIVTFQFGGNPWLEHAVKKWSETSSLPWLVAVLSKINAGHPKVPDLIEAAEKVKQDSPAFPLVVFHKLRLMMDSGQKDEARDELDILLESSKFPISSQNLFLAFRLKLASDLAEFLEYAPRTPTGITFDMDSMETPEDLENNKELKDYVDDLTFLNVDSSRVLDEQMPLSLLKEVSANEILPENIRQEIAKGTWVRAILLNNEKISREMSPILANLVPELKEYLDVYISAKDSEARKFAAIFMFLKFPGLQPYAGSGLARMTPLGEIDSYRDNWWTSFKQEGDENGADREYYSMGYAITGPIKILYPEDDPWFPDFLTGAQKALAREEWKELYQIETAPNYLCSQVIGWAKKNPNDPRVPEALHLAVKSTRYGITDKDTSGFSKQAFQLLHKQYPKSEWAVKTKYWY